MARAPKKSAEARRGKESIERLLRIHHLIQAGKFPNARKLAAELEVSPRCIERDIEFMRDRMNLPIAYDQYRYGYHYTEEVSAFPTVQISEGELFALIVAEKALQQYRGTSFEKPLVSAFEKLAASLPDTVSFTLDQMDQDISFRTRAETKVPLDIFEVITRATRKREQLELEYRKPGSAQPERRIVDPYHLANINGEWFLFAHCHLRKDLRTFVPSRIQAAQPTGRSFVRPKRFSIEASLQNSFGVLSGREHHEVCVHFTSAVADYITEKIWHPSQRLTPLPGGGVELKMTLNGLAEVLKWILSWGPDARVVSPPELVKLVLSSAEKLARQYSEGL
ncbi:MAG TPA: YafY family protein [Methylomirabilota bacterium]|nr:YafY family protein [Methylomirabilota bacterium]